MTEALIALVVATTVLIPGLVFRRFKGRFLTIVETTSDPLAILEVAVAGLFLTVLMVPIYLATGLDPLTPLWTSSASAAQIAAALKANWAGLLFHSFVVPVLVAIMAAYVERRGWLADGLAFIGLQPMAKNPSPWAAAWLAHRGEVPLCTVTLKNDQVVYGQFGPEGTAAVLAGSRDIFLDALYVLDEESGDLVRQIDCSGIFIAGDEIRMVTFSDLPVPSPEEIDEEDEAVDATPQEHSEA